MKLYKIKEIYSNYHHCSFYAVYNIDEPFDMLDVFLNKKEAEEYIEELYKNE